MKLFENSISVSTKSDKNAHGEELYVEIWEQETRDVHGRIEAIERCVSNGQSRYILFFAQIIYKYSKELSARYDECPYSEMLANCK